VFTNVLTLIKICVIIYYTRWDKVLKATLKRRHLLNLNRSCICWPLKNTEQTYHNIINADCGGLHSLIRVRQLIGANGAEIRENERNLSLARWFAKLISPGSVYPIYPCINFTRNENKRECTRNRYTTRLCKSVCAL